MASLDETHDDRILRILRDAKECMTAKQITDKIHAELGGGITYTVPHIEARLAKISGIRRDGDKYCV